jgi:hypothetical protein
MTTFTTEDREHAFGATINVEPIPFVGWVNTAPPHIVDSGASVMVKELTDDEIIALWKPMPDTKVYVRDLYAFARAVLKKAQEK